MLLWMRKLFLSVEKQGLKQGFSCIGMSVKDLCSERERHKKKCKGYKWLEAEGRKEHESNFAGWSK